MKDFELLSLELNTLANNVNSHDVMNRIDYLQHNMDRAAYEKDYLRLDNFVRDFPEDIAEGNVDLEMYESWLKK